MKKTLLIMAFLVFLLALGGALAEEISIDEAHFPDQTLRAAVMSRFDSDRSGSLSDAERNDVLSVTIVEAGVKSLKGLELFPNLEKILCYNNRLTSLDLEGMPSLLELNCSVNPIGSLDVSGFPNLEILYCGECGLTSLKVDQNSRLQMLFCQNNQLTSLNTEGLTALTYLNCSGNRLTSLNAAAMPALEDLVCNDNRLTSLNLDENIYMNTLNCERNQLSVSAVDGAFDLNTLPGFELIRSQDFTGGDLNGSVLTVKQSEKIYYKYACGAGYNCTFILDVIVTSSGAQGLPIDDAHFPDGVFRTYVYETLDKNRDGVLSDAERNAVTMISVNEKEIRSLQGVEYFPALERLNCISCKLKSLDVSALSQLKSLSCNRNALETLNVSRNGELTRLECENNSLTSLDLSGNPKLQHLGCSGNRLEFLDLSRNPALEEAWCQNDWLTELDLSHNPELKYLDCYGNFLTTLDVSKNAKLQTLSCGDCRITWLDVSHNTALTTLYGDQRRLALESVNGKFDLNAWPGFDVTKSSNWTVGSVSGHILTVPGTCKVTYDYDCGGGHTITCTVQVNDYIVEDDPAEKPGNVTGDPDGTVDGRDVLRLAKFLAGDGVQINRKAADVNADGAVDGRDLIRLARYLAGDPVELKQAQ